MLLSIKEVYAKENKWNTVGNVSVAPSSKGGVFMVNVILFKGADSFKNHCELDTSFHNARMISCVASLACGRFIMFLR